MHFLVTGGAGFIGSHLVERLLLDRQEVTVVDDLSTGSRAVTRRLADRIRFIEGDISDPRVCEQAATGVDFVLHQAALGSVPRSIERPLPTHQANATGTLNMLIAAKDAGVRRFIYAGSSSSYGNTPELPKHEGMPTRPLSPYAVAKLCGENYASAFHAVYGLETVILRYFNVFGPRQDPQSQYAAVIPKFITAALRNETPTIHGDGEQTRDFTYVSNVVEANLHACTAPNVAGEIFNISAGARTSLNQLWDQIVDLTGTRAIPQYVPARRGDVRDSLASLEKTRNILGFNPSVSIADGLRLTVESFQSAI